MSRRVAKEISITLENRLRQRIAHWLSIAWFSYHHQFGPCLSDQSSRGFLLYEQYRIRLNIREKQ